MHILLKSTGKWICNVKFDLNKRVRFALTFNKMYILEKMPFMIFKYPLFL